MIAPTKIPRPLLITIAFFIGLFVDMFYDSPGVHAAASVFSAYARSMILRFLEPDIGYDTDHPFNLNKVGILWFISYCGVFLLAHLFFYYSVEAFSFVFFYEIIMSTIISLLFSVFIMLIFILLSNPKY